MLVQPFQARLCKQWVSILCMLSTLQRKFWNPQKTNRSVHVFIYCSINVSILNGLSKSLNYTFLPTSSYMQLISQLSSKGRASLMQRSQVQSLRKKKDGDLYIYPHENLNNVHKNVQKSHKIFKTRHNVLSTRTNIVKNWLSLCLMGCVWFARYCGKMYSRHLFSYGGLVLKYKGNVVDRQRLHLALPLRGGKRLPNIHTLILPYHCTKCG